MEKLSDLPTKDDAEMSPQENDVMKKYFNASPSSKTSGKKLSWIDTFKIALYAAILFVALSNPWVDTLFCAVPYCGDNALILLGAKFVLFIFIFVLMYRFLISA